MDNPPVSVRHAERLLEAFGFWPSFHDAEVLRAELDRGIKPALPSVTLEVHAFATDGTIDDRGHYRITTSVLVTLRFEAVNDLELHNLGFQNVLSELILEPQPDGRIGVELGECFGLHGVFTCADIDVREVRPWPSPGDDRPLVRSTGTPA